MFTYDNANKISWWIGGPKFLDKPHTFNIVFNRFSKQKGVLFSLSVFFLKRYHALRCYPQESYYNLARAFHQIDLLPQAIFYYNKCLQSQSIKAGPDVQQDPAKAVGSNQKLTIFSTERFAAYNLTRIYLNSGAKIPALKLLRKYPLQ